MTHGDVTSDRPPDGILLTIVYLGPAGAGKSTSLEHIRAQAHHSEVSRLFTTPPARPDAEGHHLWFDYRPLWAQQPRSLPIYLRLATVPGAVFDDTARHELLVDVDAIVFVIDVRITRIERSQESLENMREHLGAARLANIPHAFQANHLDSPEAVPTDDLPALLSIDPGRIVNSVATTGVGVIEAFRHVARPVLVRSRQRAGAFKSFKPLF